MPSEPCEGRFNILNRFWTTLSNFCGVLGVTSLLRGAFFLDGVHESDKFIYCFFIAVSHLVTRTLHNPLSQLLHQWVIRILAQIRFYRNFLARIRIELFVPNIRGSLIDSVCQFARNMSDFLVI